MREKKEEEEEEEDEKGKKTQKRKRRKRQKKEAEEAEESNKGLNHTQDSNSVHTSGAFFSKRLRPPRSLGPLATIQMPRIRRLPHSLSFFVLTTEHRLVRGLTFLRL